MDADWKAFIAAEVIKRVIVLGNDECQGCKEGFYCPLLHVCTTTSLLKKLEWFLESWIKPQMMNDLDSILNVFNSRYILMNTREAYIEMAQDFLNDSTAESVYYGKFITKFNDHAICGPCFTPYIEPPKQSELEGNDAVLDETVLEKELMDACEEIDKANIAKRSKRPQSLMLKKTKKQKQGKKTAKKND